MKLRLPIIVAGLCMLTAPLRAETIVEEDFQDGKADGWGGTGDGDLRLTTYEKNVSMRLQKRAAAITRLSTEGYTNVTVAVSFAAVSLESNEECIADASADDGKTWAKLFSIGRPQADGVSLHRGTGAAPALDNSPAVLLRFSVHGDDDSDTCWFDDVKVSGDAKQAQFSPSARLTLTDLQKGEQAPMLRPFSAFAPPATARPPTHRLEGRLVLTATAARHFQAFRDVYGDAEANGRAAQTLPPFAFEFTTDGDRVVPAVRGPVVGTHANWEWVLEPGRLWDEDADGFTRASLPFALQERNANCTHHGALTFAFKADGTITTAAYQIAAETCVYFKFDLAGWTRTTYEPHAVANASALIAVHRAEIAGRIRTAPIADLARDRPGADPAQFGSRLEIDADDMTAYGFIIGGKHYVGGCETRAGPYPDCDVLPLPSYSTAKSIFAGLAAMRIEMLYPGALQASVASLVPQCTAGRWGDVKLIDALNMATGNLASTGMEVDERSSAMLPFFRADNHSAKIKSACSMFPRASAPGATFAYHTVDTYILGTALNELWRGKRGASTDVYGDVLVDPVWRPLGLSPDIYATKRTYDDARQPFTGFGLTYHRDDIARIAVLLNDSLGALNGAPMFDVPMLKQALQRDPANRGLIANGDKFRYRNGFWAWNATEYLKCAKETWIPFMSGFGGISVALMPNNTVYYYFSDGDVHAWGRAAAESNRIKKFC
jgi:hypothetical protein